MYNIRSGRNGGLESALCRLAQGQVDCGAMQETNLTNIVYTWESSGFCLTAMVVPSTHCGGVAIFYREAEHFSIKELHLHGPNTISFQLVTGRRRWHFVG